jgi:hypothetical protein
MTAELVSRFGALALAGLCLILMAVTWVKAGPDENVGCPFLVFGFLAVVLIVVGVGL